MTLLLALLRLGAGLFAFGAATVSLLALFGFAVPEFDILNHLQVFIFLGTLAGLVAVVLLFRDSWRRAALVAFAATGFVASAAVFVPEAVGALLPRPPLPADERPVLKAMTHNLFGLNYEMERVAAFIARENPDIIALQEYFIEQREPLHELLRVRYPHFAFCTGGKRANVGLYAKMPFTTTEQGACSEVATPTQRTSRILGTFMLEDGTTFSVLTTHLDWPYPVSRQQSQILELAETIAAVRGPLIVMGDMNSTPWSYALRGLVAATGMERHSRNLVTYPLKATLPLLPDDEEGLVRLFPFLPLDHVMTRNGVSVHEMYAGPDTNSDHLPVIFSFSVAPLTECCAAPQTLSR